MQHAASFGFRERVHGVVFVAVVLWRWGRGRARAKSLGSVRPSGWWGVRRLGRCGWKRKGSADEGLGAFGEGGGGLWLWEFWGVYGRETSTIYREKAHFAFANVSWWDWHAARRPISSTIAIPKKEPWPSAAKVWSIPNKLAELDKSLPCASGIPKSKPPSPIPQSLIPPLHRPPFTPASVNLATANTMDPRAAGSTKRDHEPLSTGQGAVVAERCATRGFCPWHTYGAASLLPRPRRNELAGSLWAGRELDRHGAERSAGIWWEPCEAFWVFGREFGVSRVFGGRQPDMAEEVYVSMARAWGRLFVSIALVFLFQPCLQNYSHLPAGKGAPVPWLLKDRGRLGGLDCCAVWVCCSFGVTKGLSSSGLERVRVSSFDLPFKLESPKSTRRASKLWMTEILAGGTFPDWKSSNVGGPWVKWGWK